MKEMEPLACLGCPRLEGLLEIIAYAADVIEGRITTDLNRERNANKIRQAAGLPVKAGGV